MSLRVLSVTAVLTLTLATSATAEPQSAASIHLDVHKSPSCGCCTLWMSHLEEQGFSSTAHHPDDLGALKRELGVPARYGSCHTAVTDDGYVFEGHVPARYVRQFLASPPADALGLTVPAMPVGSPGMEYGDHFNGYDVLLLKNDGSVEVYAKVTSYEQQFH